MAEVKLEKGALRSPVRHLVANQIDTIVFPSYVEDIQIRKDEGAAIFATVDETAPVIDGQKTYELPGGVAGILRIDRTASRGSATVVKLISAGTPEYSVARL